MKPVVFAFSIVNLFVGFIALTLVSGCTTPEPAIPIEKQGEYSLLTPGEISMISYIDGRRYSAIGKMSRNVSPGTHSVETVTCPSGTTVGCWTTLYKLDTEAGKEYVLLGSRIQVKDRLHPEHVVENMYLYHGVWVTSHVMTEKAAEVARNQALQQEEQMDRRRANISMVRKIGARICQERRGNSVYGNIIYVGFVEGMTDEKVQIRISDAYFKNDSNVRPGGFSSSIIWDSPLNWDLCE